MALSERQALRYARHLSMPEIGEDGQERLLAAKVLVIGAGGLGSGLLPYLAAAGVGRIGIVDHDVVDLSNLQRQVIHRTGTIGRPKTESAQETLRGVNPDIVIDAYDVRFSAENAFDLIRNYDLVVDASDNFSTRFLINDACRLAGRMLVSATVLRFGGQLATFAPEGPCYRCLYPTPPDPAVTPPNMVLGAMAGVMGTLQAVETLKQILGLGPSLSGSLLIVDGLVMRFQRIALRADPDCPLCGARPTIRDLS